MSKVLKMVEARQTGNRYAEIPQVRFTDTTSQVPYSYSSGLIYEYDCELTLGGRALAKDEQDLHYQLERLRIQLAHELYGEFKDTIVEMYKALQNRDITEALRFAYGGRTLRLSSCGERFVKRNELFEAENEEGQLDVSEQQEASSLAPQEDKRSVLPPYAKRSRKKPEVPQGEQ